MKFETLLQERANLELKGDRIFVRVRAIDLTGKVSIILPLTGRQFVYSVTWQPLYSIVSVLNLLHQLGNSSFIMLPVCIYTCLLLLGGRNNSGGRSARRRGLRATYQRDDVRARILEARDGDGGVCPSRASTRDDAGWSSERVCCVRRWVHNRHVHVAES